MEVIAGKYVVECMPNGEYYAYLMENEQCFAYGETVEDAIENVEVMAQEFLCEISSVYGLEDMA